MKFNLVDAIEFDKYAVKSYNAIFGTDISPTDIREVKQLPKCDFFTYGFPCQDISVAGTGKGIAKGTRSGLLFEVERLLENAQYKPKFLLMENVKNLVGIKHKADFDRWLKKLNELGYENYWQVLNSKEYGIPQNRERVFCLSVREDVNNAHWFPMFQFPIKQELKLKLRDLIEEHVDNKYYLNDVVLEKIKHAKTNSFVNKKADFDGNCFDTCYHPSSQEFIRTGFSDKYPTLAARDYKDPKCVQVGNVKNEKFDKMHESSKRVYSLDGISPTINCCGGGNLECKILDDTYKNRKIRVYKKVSPTLRVNHIFKVSIAASRGRKIGTRTKQKLEVNSKGVSNSLTTVLKDNLLVESKENILISQEMQKGYVECSFGEVADLSYLNSNTRRGRVQEKGMICPTLLANNQEICKMESIQKVRKLTPKEYWRLQGFDDISFHKAEEVNSNSQLYKQAGNSITVDVLVAIYKQIQKHFQGEFEDGIDVVTLFSGIGAFEKAFERM